MKKLLTSVAALALTVTLVGCSGPAAYRAGTATAIIYGLRNSPDAVGYLRDAQPILCAFANGEHLTPDDLATAIDSSGIDGHKDGAAILTGVTVLYIAAYDSLGSKTNSSTVRPYAKAICDGATIGLGALPGPASKSRNSPPVVAKWRLLKR